MVSDPYKVLEISPGADKEEIKKAYRRMAKKYHPDLHPNDKEAAEKMNEINEAYDILSNPEKYQKRQSSGGGYGGAYQNQTGGGYGSYQNQTGGGYGSYQNQSQGSYGSYGGQAQGGYGQQGNYGWYTYDFDDLFGFGKGQAQAPRPQAEASDAADIRQAIDFINMKQYSYASQTLNNVVSARRNARWFYLSAITNHGLGNSILASEQIQKAVDMEPGNQTYRQTQQWLRQSGNTYTQAGSEFQKYADGMGQMCFSFCALQFFCTFCRCC